MKRLLCGLLLTLPLALANAATDGAGSSAAEPVPLSKTIPFKKEEAEAGPSAGRAFTIAAVLLGVAAAGIYFARRHVPNLPATLSINKDARRRLRLLDTMRLNSKTSLFLVQFDDRELLLAQSCEHVTLVVDTRSGAGVHDNKEMARDG